MFANTYIFFVSWVAVFQYFVTIATGDRPAAGTDANVFITIRGERGDTGIRKLKDYTGHDVFKVSLKT